MAKRISAAQAKAHFSTIVAQVAHGGDHYVIERRGKPVAALVRVDELARLEQECAASDRRLGVLAIVGAWRQVGDGELNAIVADIYAERERDRGRQVALDV